MNSSNLKRQKSNGSVVESESEKSSQNSSDYNSSPNVQHSPPPLFLVAQEESENSSDYSGYDIPNFDTSSYTSNSSDSDSVFGDCDYINYDNTFANNVKEDKDGDKNKSENYDDYEDDFNNDEMYFTGKLVELSEDELNDGIEPINDAFTTEPSDLLINYKSNIGDKNKSDVNQLNNYIMSEEFKSGKDLPVVENENINNSNGQNEISPLDYLFTNTLVEMKLDNQNQNKQDYCYINKSNVIFHDKANSLSNAQLLKIAKSISKKSKRFCEEKVEKNQFVNQQELPHSDLFQLDDVYFESSCDSIIDTENYCPSDAKERMNYYGQPPYDQDPEPSVIYCYCSYDNHNPQSKSDSESIELDSNISLQSSQCSENNSVSDKKLSTSSSASDQSDIVRNVFAMKMSKENKATWRKLSKKQKEQYLMHNPDPVKKDKLKTTSRQFNPDESFENLSFRNQFTKFTPESPLLSESEDESEKSDSECIDADDESDESQKHKMKLNKFRVKDDDYELEEGELVDYKDESYKMLIQDIKTNKRRKGDSNLTYLQSYNEINLKLQNNKYHQVKQSDEIKDKDDNEDDTDTLEEGEIVEFGDKNYYKKIKKLKKIENDSNPTDMLCQAQPITEVFKSNNECIIVDVGNQDNIPEREIVKKDVTNVTIQDKNLFKNELMLEKLVLENESIEILVEKFRKEKIMKQRLIKKFKAQQDQLQMNNLINMLDCVDIQCETKDKSSSASESECNIKEKDIDFENNEFCGFLSDSENSNIDYSRNFLIKNYIKSCNRRKTKQCNVDQIDKIAEQMIKLAKNEQQKQHKQAIQRQKRKEFIKNHEILQHVKSKLICIEKGLFLSTTPRYPDFKLLNEHNIELVILMCHKNNLYPKLHPEIIHHVEIIKDNPNANMLCLFPMLYLMMLETLAKGKSVLVHSSLSNQALSAPVMNVFLIRFLSHLQQSLQIGFIGPDHYMTYVSCMLTKKCDNMMYNQGFYFQIYLYYQMGYTIDRTNHLFRYFYFKYFMYVLGNSAMFQNILHAVKGQNLLRPFLKHFLQIDSGKDREKDFKHYDWYICRNCNFELCTELNMLNSTGPEQKTGHYESLNRCKSLFVEPLEWMYSVDGALMNQCINCPLCKVIIGYYDLRAFDCWNGKSNDCVCVKHSAKHLNIFELESERVKVLSIDPQKRNTFDPYLGKHPNLYCSPVIKNERSLLALSQNNFERQEWTNNELNSIMLKDAPTLESLVAKISVDISLTQPDYTIFDDSLLKRDIQQIFKTNSKTMLNMKTNSKINHKFAKIILDNANLYDPEVSSYFRKILAPNPDVSHSKKSVKNKFDEPINSSTINKSTNNDNASSQKFLYYNFYLQVTNNNMKQPKQELYEKLIKQTEHKMCEIVEKQSKHEEIQRKSDVSKLNLHCKTLDKSKTKYKLPCRKSDFPTRVGQPHIMSFINVTKK